MLPGVVVLGVLLQHSGGEGQLALGQLLVLRAASQPLHDTLPVVPHLVVLRLVDDYGGGEVQLGLEVRVQRAEYLTPVVPGGEERLKQW